MRSSERLVAILGCGPAGLFAAQAAAECGCEPVILSMKKQSEIRGAQFLHQPIRGLTNLEADGRVRIMKLGQARNYAARVYRDESVQTSWESWEDDVRVPAWDLRAAYDAAWQKWSDKIVPMEFSTRGIRTTINELLSEFEFVISTIPASVVCRRPVIHRFNSIPIFVQEADLPNYRTDSIVYNGLPIGNGAANWHRSSWIFGHGSVESRFPDDQPPDAKWIKVPKIVDNTCNCHPLLHRAGRLGRWERGVLTHHAYEDTVKIIMGD